MSWLLQDSGKRAKDRNIHRQLAQHQQKSKITNGKQLVSKLSVRGTRRARVVGGCPSVSETPTRLAAFLFSTHQARRILCRGGV